MQKKLTQIIREQFPKAKTQTLGETVRVASTSKNELQMILRLLTVQDFAFPLRFSNYR